VIVVFLREEEQPVGPSVEVRLAAIDEGLRTLAKALRELETVEGRGLARLSADDLLEQRFALTEAARRAG
jgi:hypothetical protein